MEISKLQKGLAAIHIQENIYEQATYLEQIRLILDKEDPNYKN